MIIKVDLGILLSLIYQETKRGNGGGLVAKSYLTLCDSMNYSLPASSVHEIFPGKSPGVGCHFPFQGMLPTRDWNWVSYMAGGFFTNWATREPSTSPKCLITPSQQVATISSLFLQWSYVL